jgi:preprotein translocase subunit YajC
VFIETAYAMGSSGDSAQGAGQFSSLILMAVIFGIFYFIMIRPQQKKMKDHKKLVDAIKKGDRIIMSSGIYGTVDNMTPQTLTIKIAEGVKIKIGRASVATVLKDGEEEKE